jgi:hypothetical protein
VSLRAPNRPLSGSVAFTGHLGLNTVQKSKGKAKNPLTQRGSSMSPRVHCLAPPGGPLVPLAGFYFPGGARAGFSTNRRGWRLPSQPRKTQPVHQQSLGLDIPIGLEI